MKRIVLLTIGVLFFIAGIISAVYLNVWCFVTGIVDIYHAVRDGSGSIAHGVLWIVLREFFGFLALVAGVGIGFLCFSFSSNKTVVRRFGKK